MIRVLGWEKCKNGIAYNVHVCFESNKQGLVGEQVATIYVKEDTFESQFSDVQPGDKLAMNVGFKEVKFTEAKTSEWRPYLTF